MDVLNNNLQPQLKGSESTSSHPSPPPQSNPQVKGSEDPNQNFWEQGIDPFELAILMVHESLNLEVHSAQIEAKAVQANAMKQNILINEEANMRFYTLPHADLYKKKWGRIEWSKVTAKCKWNDLPRTYKWVPKNPSQNKLNNMQLKNMEISASRSIMEDKLSVLKQNASVQETNCGTDGQESVQAESVFSGLLDTQKNIFNQVCR